MLAALNRTDAAVLRALSLCAVPLPQHALARQLGIAVNSTRAATQRLARRGLVIVRREKNRVYSQLNDSNPLALWYRTVFENEAAILAAERVKSMDLAETTAAVDDLNEFVHAFRAANL